jgi:hypothetical protein
MPPFALLLPTEEELSDAQEALAAILELGDAGELDVPPYLARLLLQLQDILLVTSPQPIDR